MSNGQGGASFFGGLTLLPPIAPPFSLKQILREKLRGERRAAAKPDAGKHAARLFLDAIPIPEGAAVSLYLPIKDELDTEPLAVALIERGVAIALPVIVKKGAPLVFRRYAPGDKLTPNGFGTSAPAPDAEAVLPDIVVAPLLGFTRAGGRLGYGGGFYDRTLEALRKEKQILAVGFAYGAQEVDALPLSPLDQPLDYVVTEREAIRVRSR